MNTNLIAANLLDTIARSISTAATESNEQGETLAAVDKSGELPLEKQVRMALASGGWEEKLARRLRESGIFETSDLAKRERLVERKKRQMELASRLGEFSDNVLVEGADNSMIGKLVE